MAIFDEKQWREIDRRCRAIHEAVQNKQKVVVDELLVDSSYFDARDPSDPGAVWYFDHEMTPAEHREQDESDDAEASPVINFARDTADSADYETTIKNLDEIIARNNILVEKSDVRRCALACKDSEGNPTLFFSKVLQGRQPYQTSSEGTRARIVDDAAFMRAVVRAAEAAGCSVTWDHGDIVLFTDLSPDWAGLECLRDWRNVRTVAAEVQTCR